MLSSMRKLVHAFAIMCLVALATTKVEAQDRYIGARFGVNLANESIAPNPWETASTTIQPGLMIGGQIEFPMSGVLALSAQVLYDQKGSNENLMVRGTDTYETDTEMLIYNYLEIPILLKVSFGSGSIKPFLFAGPSIGFFLSGTNKIRSSGGPIFPFHLDTSLSVSDSTIYSPEISVIFGGGLSFQLVSGPMVFIDASYSLGLVNIDNDNTEFMDKTTVKSRDIRLAAGILFPLD